MKKLFLSTLMLLALSAAVAQTGNVVIFSEGGERFTAIMNGLRMNDAPATNVKVEALNQPGYKLKVIFEDNTLGEISKDIMVAMGEEAVYMVKLDKKGGYKVAWRSSTPIAQAPPAPPSQVVYQWGAPVVVATNPANTGTNTVIVEETVTTTTTGGAVGTNVNTGTGENVTMTVVVPGFDMNVNINAGDNVTTTNGISTISTTTTTTTTTTGVNNGGSLQVIEPVATATPCAMLDGAGYENAKSSISAKSFEDSKMTLAKQITKSNCLSAIQVKGFMELFGFEQTKLEFAKFAYNYCYEQNNYYVVNDAFGFESSIEDLDAYISAQR